MSMALRVKGYAPPDATWQKMKAAWDACAAAGVEVPQEVVDFFGGEAPDAAGVEVELPVREWVDGDREGYELTVAALPPQVQVIRFWASW